MPSKDEFCPVAKAAQAFGDRWSLLLIREMLRGVTRFNELQRSMPGISRSVLSQRLGQLGRAGVIARSGHDGKGGEYVLSEAGRELASVIQSLNDWGTRWLVPEGGPAEVDPDGLMLWVRRHVVLDALPHRRVVVEFELRRSDNRERNRRYWLLLQEGEASLCPLHPGFAEDLWIRAEVGALYRIFLGTLRMADARDQGLFEIEGNPALVRSAPRWFRIR